MTRTQNELALVAAVGMAFLGGCAKEETPAPAEKPAEAAPAPAAAPVAAETAAAPAETPVVAEAATAAPAAK